MTYGSVAEAIGSRAARAVGRVMARWGDEVPWWRVVPATGRPISGHAQESLARYRDEGTPLAVPVTAAGVADTAAGWRIDLPAALWHPAPRRAGDGKAD